MLLLHWSLFVCLFILATALSRTPIFGQPFIPFHIPFIPPIFFPLHQVANSSVYFHYSCVPICTNSAGILGPRAMDFDDISVRLPRTNFALYLGQSMFLDERNAQWRDSRKKYHTPVPRVVVYGKGEDIQLALGHLLSRVGLRGCQFQKSSARRCKEIKEYIPNPDIDEKTP